MLKKFLFMFLLVLSVPLYATAATVNLPWTGQDLCYDPNPDVVTNTGVISCTGTGQDGATQFGAVWPIPRFTDNGNGTVTDNLTSLVWLQDMKCTALNPPGGSSWLDALSAANGLVSGCTGLTDLSGGWRLPNVNELESLVDLSQSGPPFPAGHPFINFDSGSPNYWSSTITAVFPQNAEGVELFTSTVRGDVKTSLKNVWAVKGTSNVPQTGQTACWDIVGIPVTCPAGADGVVQAGLTFPSPRFTDNHNGTLTDNLTGLTWLQQADCFRNTPTQAAALTAAKTLAAPACGLGDASVAGDWRLPNRGEMRSLVNYQQSDGGAWMLTQGFTNPGTSPIGGWYWTSDSYPSLVDVLHPLARNLKWMVKTEGGTWTNDAVEGDVTQAGPRFLLPVRGGKRAQRITFNSTTGTFGDPPINLSTLVPAAGGSGNPVTFTLVSGTGALSGLNNATLALNGAGSIVVKASQAGNAAFNAAADTPQTITVDKALATVTLTGSTTQTYDGTPKSLTATTTAVPPGPVAVTITYNGSTTVPSNAGTYTVVASITDPNYQGSDATDTLVILPASASVTLASLDQSYDGGPKSATATTVPPGRAVSFTYDGSPVPPTNVGTYAVVATVTDPNYTGTAAGSLTVSPRTPTIIWSDPAAIFAGTALSATQLNATAGGIPGSFVYTPAAGVVLPEGVQTLSVTFTPTDSANNTSASKTVSLAVTAPGSFAVSFAAGSNGSLTGTASQIVASGGSTTPVTAVPATGFHFVQWTGTGGFTSTSNPIILSNVTANQTLSASFAVNTFLVTFSAPGGNGTITCTSPVNYGSDCVCTVTATSGFHLFTLSDNSVDKLSAVAGTSFTITGVTADHNVSAAFARPNGILNPATGKTRPDLTDAVTVLKLVANKNGTASDFARADIAPLGSDGRPAGDGHLDIYDVIGILRMSIGLD